MEELEFSDMSGENVEFPEARIQVVSALRSLADKQHQIRVWRDGVREPNDAWDDLTMVVNMLFDDTRVLEDPVASVGQVLRNHAEAEALQGLANLLDSLIAQLGDSPDSSYLESPSWPAIIEAARAALNTMA
ncbi:hypothetical protein J7E93_17280 [Streptomyces sp. ISL-36]|uniref:SCO4402 family protein n=1 Tax=Streptomyces sp. ISL-36 TaxID=2819182 RepID=UPI001BECE556|nr:hypothetical protein [Streptomyces sp. ISL-36]MBT2441831.1 hypothetical protein [Streptomyces sp. ISL-36]